MTDAQAPNARFFDDAMEIFSALRTGTVVRDFAVADLRLRMEFAKGETEKAFARAFAHIEIPRAGDPDLTIAVWDSDSTGSAPLRATWGIDDYGSERLIKGFNDARYFAIAPFCPVPAFGMIDRKTRRGFHWVRSATELPHWEHAAPMRPLLHEWLSERGHLPMHGGAVGYADGGVLLAGSGGSGKSNSALACLASDLLYASDDFCVLSESPQWQVHSLYCSGKMFPPDIRRHPHLAPYVSNRDNPDDEKSVFFLNEAFREKLVRSMPLKAVVLPRVVGKGASVLMLESKAIAQRGVAISTMALSQARGGATFARIANLVRTLPCYALNIGEDFENVPNLIRALLRSLR